jgi:hypothetical protein
MSKYPRTFHLPISPGVSSDDKIITTTKGLLGVEIVITEKLDGGNVKLFDGQVYSRSTGQPATEGWFAMVKKHHAWKTFGSNYQFFGEDLFGIHSIVYDPMYENETFRLFNIRLNDLWLSWDDVVSLAGEYQFKHVPVLFRGVFETEKELFQWIAKHSKQPSALGGAREGFVIRVAREFADTEFSTVVAKWVRANHVATDQHWRVNWQPCKLIG